MSWDSSPAGYFFIDGRRRIDIPKAFWPRYWALKEAGLSERFASRVAILFGDAKKLNKREKDEVLAYLKLRGQCWLGVYSEETRTHPETIEESYRTEE